MKRNRGVTLIALVVTIVIMLIIIGVTIMALIGENGLIGQSKKVAEEQRGASVQEVRDLWCSEKQLDEYLETKIARGLQDILNELKNQRLLTEEEVEYIKANGKIKIGSRTIIFDDSIKTEEDMKAKYAQIKTWIPIYTRAQLEKIGSNNKVKIEEEGTEYTFTYGEDIGYILKNDITLSGNFTPLPELASGVFLGNNKKINNMVIGVTYASGYVGLFKSNKGTISYLKLEDCNITISKDYNTSGGIVGYNYGTITECSYSGKIDGGERNSNGRIYRRNCWI